MARMKDFAKHYYKVSDETHRPWELDKRYELGEGLWKKSKSREKTGFVVKRALFVEMEVGVFENDVLTSTQRHYFRTRKEADAFWKKQTAWGFSNYLPVRALKPKAPTPGKPRRRRNKNAIQA